MDFKGQRREEIERFLGDGRGAYRQEATRSKTHFGANGVEEHVFGEGGSPGVVGSFAELVGRGDGEADGAEPGNEPSLQILHVRKITCIDRRFRECRLQLVSEFLPHARHRHKEGGLGKHDCVEEGTSEGIRTSDEDGDGIHDRNHRVDELSGNVVHGEEGHETVVRFGVGVVINHFRVVAAAVVRAHDCFGSALAVTHTENTNGCAGGVDERGAVSGLDCVRTAHNFLRRNGFTELHPVIPSIHLRKAIVLVDGRHTLLRPVDNNGLQIGELIADGGNFRGTLSSLAHADGCFGVMEHIAAGIR